MKPFMFFGNQFTTVKEFQEFINYSDQEIIDLPDDCEFSIVIPTVLTKKQIMDKLKLTNEIVLVLN